jgi:hypothetical protein
MDVDRDRKRRRGENSLVNYGRMKNLYQHCEKLLVDVLMKDKASQVYFNQPVDPVALSK